MRETTLLPKARTEGLIINELTDEVLVYDLRRDKAHCLNPTAAAVWRLCDGQSTAAQIAGRLLSEPGADRGPQASSSLRVVDATGPHGDHQRPKAVSEVDEQLVWLALEQLGRDHLLEERMRWPAAIPRMSRREAIGRLGIGAAIAVPLVISLTAPMPAQAGTCLAKGSSCGTGSQCCSKACVANKCT